MRLYLPLFLILLSGFTYSQTLKKEYTKLGEPGIPSLSYESPVKKYITDFKKEKKDTLKKKTFNDAMLNILFAKKVGKAFTGTNDLSIQKFFANINPTEESISTGFNFDDRFGDPLKRMRFVFTGGFKFQGSKTSSTLYKNINKGERFKGDNIGALLKVSYIGGGTINFTNKAKKGNVIKDRKEAIKTYRNIIYPKYDKKVQTYNSSEFPSIKELNDSLFISKLDLEMKSINSQLEEKHKKLYQEIAEDEIKYL